MKKYLVLALLIGGCKAGGGGSGAESSGTEIVITSETELSDILCAKKEALQCDDRIWEVGGFPSIVCNVNNFGRYIHGEDSKLTALQNAAASIKSDLDDAEITYSQDVTYGADERDNDVYSSKVISSDNGHDVHVAIDWTNGIEHTSQLGPYSIYGVWIQIENPDLLQHLGDCFE